MKNVFYAIGTTNSSKVASEKTSHVSQTYECIQTTSVIDLSSAYPYMNSSVLIFSQYKTLKIIHLIVHYCTVIETIF